MREPRAGVFAVVVLALLTSCSPDSNGAANVEGTPASSPTATLSGRVEMLETGCPSPDVKPQFPSGGTLPDGATQVRVCNMAGDEITFKQDRVEEDFRVPLDALTTNVDRVVDSVNAAASTPSGDVEGRTYCAGQSAPTQVLWFSYAETDLAVTYNSGTCNGLDLGEIEVDGGDTVVAAFSEALWEQRQSREPPVIRLRARCAPNLTEDTPLLLVDRLDLVDAVLCEHDQTVRQARLPDSALAAVNADFATTTAVSESQKSCGIRMLRGVTAWGDRFTWWSECWDFRMQNTTDGGRSWEPSPAVQAVLDSLPLGPPRRQVTTHPGR